MCFRETTTGFAERGFVTRGLGDKLSPHVEPICLGYRRQFMGRPEPCRSDEVEARNCCNEAGVSPTNFAGACDADTT